MPTENKPDLASAVRLGFVRKPTPRTPLQRIGYSGWQRRNEYLLESGETSLRQVVEEIERGREIGKLIICLRIVRCYPELNVNVKSYGFEHEDDG